MECGGEGRLGPLAKVDARLVEAVKAGGGEERCEHVASAVETRRASRFAGQPRVQVMALATLQRSQSRAQLQRRRTN